MAPIKVIIIPTGSEKFCKTFAEIFYLAIFRKFSRLLDVFHAFRCGKFIAFSQIPREMKKIGKSTSLALIAIVEGRRRSS